MELKGIDSFERSASPEDLEAAADMLLDEYSAKRFVLYGKALTKELKKDVEDNLKDYQKNGETTIAPTMALCVGCGEHVTPGDLYARHAAEGHILCFHCCGDDTVISEKIRLYVC